MDALSEMRQLNNRGRQHAFYLLKILRTAPAEGPSATSETVVRRRYTHFVELHALLDSPQGRALFPPGRALPPIPPRVRMRLSTERLARQRVPFLQALLDSCLQLARETREASDNSDVFETVLACFLTGADEPLALCTL